MRRCPSTRPCSATWPLLPTRRPPAATSSPRLRRACPRLGEVELFDIYRSEAIGAGKKSMAFTLHFVPEKDPLTTEEVDRYVKKILGNLKYRLGVEIR